MSNEVSNSQPKRAKDAIALFKLISGDELIGINYGLTDAGQTVIFRPTKLLLQSGPGGITHTLAPYVGTSKDPYVAIGAYHIVYEMKPADEIIEAYCAQLQAAKHWEDFREQGSAEQAKAMQAAIEQSDAAFALTLH